MRLVLALARERGGEDADSRAEFVTAAQETLDIEHVLVRWPPLPPATGRLPDGWFHGHEIKVGQCGLSPTTEAENRPPDVSDGSDEGTRSSGPGASKPGEEMLRSILIADRSQSSAGAALQIHQHRRLT